MQLVLFRLCSLIVFNAVPAISLQMAVSSQFDVSIEVLVQCFDPQVVCLDLKLTSDNINASCS